MVLSIPGSGSGTVEKMSSHLDIPATLLPRLGVKNPPEDYSLGHDLTGSAERTFTVTGHWRTLGYIDASYKASFALDNSHFSGHHVTTADDVPVRDAEEFYASHKENLVQVMRDISRFKAR